MLLQYVPNKYGNDPLSLTQLNSVEIFSVWLAVPIFWTSYFSLDVVDVDKTVKNIAICTTNLRN